MIENCIGSIKLPIGVVWKVKINSEILNIPLVTEEPSVIAACNYGCKMISSFGDGFYANSTRNIIRG